MKQLIATQKSRCVQEKIKLKLSFNIFNVAGGGSTIIEKETKRITKESPRYKVLLHNDPVNTMEYVVITLQEVVPQLNEQDALAIMLEAHNTGVGLVITCDIEPAEFYAERLNSKGLTTTIEKES